MEHTCHAKDCKITVPPRMFMCTKHWYSLPNHLRAAIWATYVPGQEITKTPSRQYLEAVQKTIDYIAEKEKVSNESK